MAITRRDFLRTSTAVAVAPGLALARNATERNCIFLMLVGGPSQLDTWDPKPESPSDVRGPFRPIPTQTPGLLFTELFPKTAAMTDKIAVVRSMHHTAAPIHETGFQLMQTGRLADCENARPHIGAMLSAAKGGRSGAPANVLLPGPIGFTGVNIDHGQAAGRLGADHAPVSLSLPVQSDPHRNRYGATDFGDNCLRAARHIESGSRFVTVNMFQTVYDTISWDCHAAGGSLRSELTHYPSIAASFDLAYSAIIDDLHQRGLLESTLVVATGEFGRTPRLNREGGRDHWAGVWTSLLAGGGVRGGQVIGASDRLGGEPKDYPVTPEQFAASIEQALGLPASSEPIRGLFA
jgi:hypothetical protein